MVSGRRTVDIIDHPDTEGRWKYKETQMKITTLVENTVYRASLRAEHGVAMLIEADGRRILFDTGQSGEVLLENSNAMGIDLRTVDALVLSHGHYDHTGGIRALSALITSVDTYGHSDLFNNKWAKTRDTERYIGIPVSRQAMSAWGFRLRLSKEPEQVSASVRTTGEIPRVTEFETIESRLCLREGDDFVQDPLTDDLSLVIRSERGLILVLGCAHSGLVIILKHVHEMYGEEKIYLVIGGTHLVNASNARIQKTIDTLKDYHVEKIAASHCTGEPAVISFHEALGDKMIPNHVGDVIEI